MKKRMIWGLAGILLLTAIVAGVHLSTREKAVEGQLLVSCGGTETAVEIGKLELRSVQGTISNAKGETREIDAMGVPVAEILKSVDAAEFSTVTAVADDEYRADLTAAEAEDEQNVFFVLQEDGGLQLIVFTDNNSKRNVSNVVRMEVI